MNIRMPQATIRHARFTAALLLAASAGVASAAQVRYGEPYYDAARDVMVTPRMMAPSSHEAATPPTREATYELILSHGRLIDGPTLIRVPHGEKITLAVQSDLADAFRVDGYDLAMPIAADRPVLLSFTAEQPGRFAYRLARTGRELGVIEVLPPPTARR